jgi:hypothetical protein
MSYREMMQFWGNLVRKVDKDAWIKAFNRRVEDSGSRLIVSPDVRRLNEVETIQQAGGKVVRLTRVAVDDQDISEIDLDNHDGFDAIIDNQDMTIQQTNEEILKLVVDWGMLYE